MESTNTDIVTDPVAHISISGVHGRDELDRRLSQAPRARENGRGPGIGRLIAGALIGAAAMYLLDPDRGSQRRALLRSKVSRADNGAAGRTGV